MGVLQINDDGDADDDDDDVISLYKQSYISTSRNFEDFLLLSFQVRTFDPSET